MVDKQLRIESSFFYLTLTDDHNKLHGSKELTSFSPSKVHLALFWMKKNLPRVAKKEFLPLIQLRHLFPVTMNVDRSRYRTILLSFVMALEIQERSVLCGMVSRGVGWFTC